MSGGGGGGSADAVGGAGHPARGYDARFSVGVVESADRAAVTVGPAGRAYVYGDYTEQVPAAAMPWVDGGLRGRGGEADAHAADGPDTPPAAAAQLPPPVAAPRRRRNHRSDTGVLHPARGAAEDASRGRRAPGDGAHGDGGSDGSSGTVADPRLPRAAVVDGEHGSSGDSGDSGDAAAAHAAAEDRILDGRVGSASWDEAVDALGGWAAPGWARGWADGIGIPKRAGAAPTRRRSSAREREHRASVAAAVAPAEPADAPGAR